MNILLQTYQNYSLYKEKETQKLFLYKDKDCILSGYQPALQANNHKLYLKIERECFLPVTEEEEIYFETVLSYLEKTKTETDISHGHCFHHITAFPNTIPEETKLYYTKFIKTLFYANYTHSHHYPYLELDFGVVRPVKKENFGSYSLEQPEFNSLKKFPLTKKETDCPVHYFLKIFNGPNLNITLPVHIDRIDLLKNFLTWFPNSEEEIPLIQKEEDPTVEKIRTLIHYFYIQESISEKRLIFFPNCKRKIWAIMNEAFSLTEREKKLLLYLETLKYHPIYSEKDLSLIPSVKTTQFEDDADNRYRVFIDKDYYSAHLKAKAKIYFKHHPISKFFED